MNIAVLTLTRDRLSYTQHCFQTLRENAGLPFDWFVLDQGSTDGTHEWLLAQEDLDVTRLEENVGICRGLNLLLDEALNPADYDCIVRFDNDAEVLQPDTLRILCELALEHKTILAPKVLGLRNPPPIRTRVRLDIGEDCYYVDQTSHLGGIFMVIPASLFSVGSFRYDETQPPWAGDELICPWWIARGGSCGYVQGLEVNHYLSTEGQEADDPVYWDRKLAEMAA